MAAPRKYPDELRERATRLAVEARKDPAGRAGAIKRIADQLDVQLPAVRLDEGPPTVDSFGVVKPTFNFTGLYDG
ncbi:hypothetical protein AB0K74_12735, partial [Streptomyces sp. NPDC056159]